MTKIYTFLKLSVFALLILGLPVLASAQYRDNDDDYYYRQNRRGGNYNRNGLRSAVRRLDNNAEQFRRAVDRELDRSRYDDRRAEDRINDLAAQFVNAVDRLENAVDNNRNINNGQDEAQNVLQLGSRIERVINRRGLNGVQDEWYRIRTDLQTIANVYGYNYRNNRGNNRNDDYYRRDRRDRDDDDDDYYRRNRNRSNSQILGFPLPF